MAEFFALSIDAGSKTKTVPARKDWTVAQLYQKVATEMGANASEFFLLYGGTPLEDMSRSLNSFSFKHSETLTYVKRQRGGSGLRALPGYIELTDEACCITGDDDPTEKRAKMPCGCAIGADAVQLQAKSTLDGGDYDFNCPSCKRIWDFSLIKHVLSANLNDDQLIATSSKANSNYVQKRENDVRQCGLCKSYGVRDFTKRFGNRERVRCDNCSTDKGRDVDICWTCGLEWKGGSSCGNDICAKMKRERLQALASCGTKTIGSVSGVPDTRACPNCGTFIQHKEACKHMDCVCGYSFCFVCLQTKDENGKWPCGNYNTPCTPASRQTTIPY